VPVATIRRSCPSCHRPFTQPDDPGRKRIYCSPACKQAAYRARQRAAKQAREQRARQRADQEWAARQRANEDTRRRNGHPSGNGHARTTGPFDTPAQARTRRRVEALLAKAASTPFAHEAAACRAKAEQLRGKYAL